MKLRPLLALCVPIAASLTSGCGTFTHAASPNVASLVEQFPFKATRPVARELRYTFTNTMVLDGKPSAKPLFAADAATRANPASRKPADVLVTASQSMRVPSAGDALSRQADAAAKQGARSQYIVDLRSTAASTGAAQNSLARAQATAGAVYSTLTAFEQMAQAWTQGTADVLGNWIRANTGAIGPGAPEGSQLQLDFIYMITGKSWVFESRSDFMVTATLVDGRGRTLISGEAFQLYIYGEKPTIEIPSDAIRVQHPMLVPPPKQELVKPLMADMWYNTHLVVAASAAIADIYRQLDAESGRR